MKNRCFFKLMKHTKNMLFTTEDSRPILIKHYRLDKKYCRRKIFMKFRINLGLDTLIKKIGDTGGTDRTNHWRIEGGARGRCPPP